MKKVLFCLLTMTLFAAAPMSAQDGQFKIIPKPSKIEPGANDFTVKDMTSVYLDSEAGLDRQYVTGLLVDAGIIPTYVENEKKADVVLTINSTPVLGNEEAYKLEVAPPAHKNKIVASADNGKGLHYALQTLRQLKTRTEAGVVIPGCTITDAPAFPWRAFMLDESRHFCGTFVTKSLLDEMARLKFNTFHWHLVDDPGWRIEIKKYPKLTELGSLRNFSIRDMSPEDWKNHFPQRTYYTQDEIRDIIDYAAIRGIRIVPEIEVPGHASASIYAYPWAGSSTPQAERPIWGDLYNVTDPKVEQFLKYILDEVIALFPSKIVHIGGDEADYSHWKNNSGINEFMAANNIPTYSDLQVWFINKMSNYLASKGCRMIGWNEITGDNIREEAHVVASQSESLAPGTLVQFWDGDPVLINKAIAKGFDIVNSYRFFTYLDYPYEVTPFEKAYSFNPIPDGIAKADEKKILGMGCQSWGEFTPNNVKLFYQIFPRIAAHSECAWVHYADKDYNDFRRRFEPLEELWKKLGYLGPQLGKY